ncbi:MAG TPA: hypothetical protein PKM71_09295, partial [Candidatus Cloacimonas sp.]|nr:hypothetical protein [Candidatus Cloacimonas sp.]
MLDAIIHPSKLPLTGLSAGMEGLSRVESTIANPALDLQEGNVRPVSMPTNPGEVVNNASQVVSDLVPSIIQGITGQKKGQLGDIMRNVGAPEPVASSIGLLGMLGLGNLATKGNIAPSVVGKSLPEIAGNVKNEVSGIGNAVKSGINNTGETIKDLSNKFWRSGLPKEEVVRLDKEYGLSNSSLVDTVKTKLNNKIGVADEAYRVAMDNAPEGKQINIRPAIEQAGKKLKKLGLITEKGTLTELGNSEIARDSVYGKLLDFYKSADSISGVGNLASKEALTEGQMLKYMKAQRQTLVNKDQFTFLRDKLNTLYKNKPSDVDVSSVVNQFYTDGENSGIKGLQQARQLTREAFQNESKFLNRNTGDLKIATEQKLSRIGTDKPLSKQELDHIRELERYIGHPIEKDA